jgi:hypothetical protein
VTCVFVWLRQRLPDFARGYRSGSLIAGIIFGVLLLSWNISFVTDMREDKAWAQRYQAQSQSDR